MKLRSFKWTVEFTVAPIWVADGFDLSDERAKAMLAHDLGYAYRHELAARVVSAPHSDAIAQAQGYASFQDRLARDASYARDVKEGLYRTNLAPKKPEAEGPVDVLVTIDHAVSALRALSECKVEAAGVTWITIKTTEADRRRLSAHGVPWQFDR